MICNLTIFTNMNHKNDDVKIMDFFPQNKSFYLLQSFVRKQTHFRPAEAEISSERDRWGGKFLFRIPVKVCIFIL